ncbi:MULTISPECIES: rodlin [unclassified Streptomyces]|uniref:rodlin n=1 Tax=unclassified Streptomyces TaxID=2593676 RepID=UPI00278C7237|nr:MULTISPECIES: rodlin [unclassified Streptomyces]
MLDKLSPAGVDLPLGLDKHATRSAQAARVDGEDAPVGLVSESLNKLCLGIPIKANIQQLIGLVNIVAIQDIPILSAPQNQQCADNSTQAKGDEPISHILDDIPVLSSNGVSNE